MMPRIMKLVKSVLTHRRRTEGRAGSRGHLRDDRGLMMQSQLLIVVIPMLMFAVISAALIHAQVDNAKDAARRSDTVADQLSALVLQNLNSGYPDVFLTASQSDLRTATIHRDPALKATAYVTSFEKCPEPNLGSTCVKIQAYPDIMPGTAKTYSYRYEPSNSIAYHGTNTAGRPMWSDSTNGLISPLGVYQVVSVDNEASVGSETPCDPCVNPGQIRKPRIIQSVNNGVLLGWLAPSNAGPAGVTGYKITSVTGDESCSNLADDVSPTFQGVDALLVLNSEFEAPESSWLCNPEPGSSAVSIRAVSPSGLGKDTIVKISDLPVTSDLVPTAPSPVTGLKVANSKVTGGTFSWNPVVCSPDPDSTATPRYRFVWVSGAEGSSPWITDPTYTATGGRSAVLQWRVDVKCAGRYNDSATVSSETASFIPLPVAPQKLWTSLETSNSVRAQWSNWECIPGTYPEFRVNRYSKLDSGGTPTTSPWVKDTSYLDISSLNPGTVERWNVEIRCRADNVLSESVTSDGAFLSTIPNPPTGLKVVGSPGMTTTQMSWSAVYCSPGATPYYKFDWLPVFGTYPWQTGTSIDASNPGTASSQWSVKAQCRYGSYASQESSPSIGTAVSFVPNAPSGLPSNFSSNASGTAPYTNNRLTWTGVTCTNSTPQYNVRQTMKNGALVAASQIPTSGWISSTYYNLPNSWVPAGSTIKMEVAARCVNGTIASAQTAWASSATSQWTTSVPAPSAPASFSFGTNGYGTWYAPNTGCVSGTRPQYLMAEGSWNSPWIDNPSSLTYYRAGWAPKGGEWYYASITARCAGPNGYSANSPARSASVQYPWVSAMVTYYSGLCSNFRSGPGTAYGVLSCRGGGAWLYVYNVCYSGGYNWGRTDWGWTTTLNLSNVSTQYIKWQC